MKTLSEVEDASPVAAAMLDDFAALPPTPTHHGNASPSPSPAGAAAGFGFRLPPSLGSADADDEGLARARRAVFRFLCDQIQRGVGILRILEPAHEALSAEVRESGGGGEGAVSESFVVLGLYT
jgi:hypothetical protein